MRIYEVPVTLPRGTTLPMTVIADGPAEASANARERCGDMADTVTIGKPVRMPHTDLLDDITPANVEPIAQGLRHDGAAVPLVRTGQGSYTRDWPA
jgi:hypothetical protein